MWILAPWFTVLCSLWPLHVLHRLLPLIPRVASLPGNRLLDGVVKGRVRAVAGKQAAVRRSRLAERRASPALSETTDQKNLLLLWHSSACLEITILRNENIEFWKFEILTYMKKGTSLVGM